MMNLSRRRFLRGAVAIGALGSLPRLTSAAPGDQVVLASIGLNGMGHHHLGHLAARSDVRIACLCDVDDRVLGRSAETVKKIGREPPRLVRDFRHVIDDTSIDAVVVATPHHWHVPIAVRAIHAGKDVYLEKPASHVFAEGRLLVEAARKHGRIVQHGTQTRSSEVTARAGEVLRSGILGEIKTSKAWNVQRIVPQKPRADEPVPEGVDYDMWLGPAPKRPFNRNRFHRTWRHYRDYGNGDIGDDGAHDIDIARWGLGVDTHPVRITAHGSRVDLKGEREYPDNMMVAYQYEGNRVLIYEDRIWTPYGMHGFDSGNAFYGTEGYMIFSRRGYFQVYLGRDEKKGPGASGHPPPSVAHEGNFIECVRSRKQPVAPAEAAHLSCGLIHLGEVAYRVGRVLRFDPRAEQVIDDREANALLTKGYREPWGIPETV